MTDAELTAAIRAAQERAKSKVPNGAGDLSGVGAADLMPLVHARDAAEAKVAAIGTVNPRSGGVANTLIQGVKRLISRALDWHVREQVEFNRASMACVQAALEAMTDMSRGMTALAAYHQQLRRELFEHLEVYHREAEELKDIRHHWVEWRTGFEERRNASEIHMLRTISELQGAFQHRVTLLEQNFRQLAGQQHSQFTKELASNTLDVQKQLWADLEKVRGEFERLIYTELRVLRQKGSAAAVTPSVVSPSPDGTPPIDWMRFSEAFRGSEERIHEQQARHAARFAGARFEVLDLGCGRGEFLEAARQAGFAARGIDQSEECVALCRAKGLAADRADLFTHLESLADKSLGGVYCAQVVEHLSPFAVPNLIRSISAKLVPGALVLVETPNPQCLAIFASHFLIDPTHTRPVPPALLRYYLEESGFGNIEIEYLAPAVESMPSLAELPTAFRERFFGGLDYAIRGRKL